MYRNSDDFFDPEKDKFLVQIDSLQYGDIQKVHTVLGGRVSQTKVYASYIVNIFFHTFVRSVRGSKRRRF